MIKIMFIEKKDSNKGTKVQKIMKEILKQKNMENLFEIKYSKDIFERDLEEIEDYNYIVDLDDINKNGILKKFEQKSVKVRSFKAYKGNTVTAFEDEELKFMLCCEDLLTDIKHEFFKF